MIPGGGGLRDSSCDVARAEKKAGFIALNTTRERGMSQKKVCFSENQTSKNGAERGGGGGRSGAPFRHRRILFPKASALGIYLKIIASDGGGTGVRGRAHAP